MERYPHLWAALLAVRRGTEVLAARPPQAATSDSSRSTTTAEYERPIEEAILTELDRHFPEQTIISEGLSPEFATEPRWIVDPLDGAVNYRNGVPHYSISIAFEGRQARDVGVVYYGPTDTVFTAVEGEGAFADGTALSVSETRSVSNALVATGFDPMTMAAQDLAQFRTFIDRTQGVRRFGSAAAELSMVAAGYFDVFFERMLRVWDTAAGTLLVEEAGGEVTRIERLDGDNSEMVLASNPHIHQELVSLVSGGSVSG
ncbi:inositol monophosphatase family protein [Halorhabdus amylolytica]|uniref:inositol monophosphatase family protein n=1 Tax=Halorhabdus amylolytica TaxID=2559573 RepID=UPI0010A9D1A9|nr:inositol monophosphatase family protein [Halorhabdus amylolytica]